MRNIISIILTLSFAVITMPSSTYAAGAGDLVKCPDFSAVYYLGEDGQRYVFPNEHIYFSWYNDFQHVATISCDALSQFPLGDRVVYQAGTRLVKMPSVPTVYVVEDDGLLRAITSEDQAKALFGTTWAERVDDVSEAFWPSFTVGEPLQDSEVPQGTVMHDDEGNLFRMEDGVAIEIDDVLDTAQEHTLNEHAIDIDDLEERLGVALALTRVDAAQAIEMLTDIITKLRTVHIDEEDEVEVEDVEELDDGGDDEEEDQEDSEDKANDDDEDDELEDGDESDD